MKCNTTQVEARRTDEKETKRGVRNQMYQFFVEPSQIQGNRIVITGSDVNHIKNVLRMKPGEKLQYPTAQTARNTAVGSKSFWRRKLSVRCGLSKKMGWSCRRG